MARSELQSPSSPWDHWISPETLISQVHNTAPFLAARMPAPESARLTDLGNSPEGFLRILSNWRNILRSDLNAAEQLQDYFALCLACHHATVATFVPTDVDSKIRGLLWRESRDPDCLRPMLRLALAARTWTEDGISKRSVRGVSGHNGEHWSVIAGGLGRLLELGDIHAAAEAEAAIESEIAREQSIFDQAAAERDGELDVLRLATALAHNRGDLKQGMSFWKRKTATAPLIERFIGCFPAALRVYQQTGLAADGHRHYPLRAVRPLRRSPELLIHICPFLDDWGGVVARMEDSNEVLSAMLTGCQKVPGQQGYYRAIAGMYAVSPGAFERAAAHMPNAAQRLLRSAEVRKLIDIPRISFESMMRKRARAALGRT